jgi:hypothetical protein
MPYFTITDFAAGMDHRRSTWAVSISAAGVPSAARVAENFFRFPKFVQKKLAPASLTRAR